jgi:hypothetical protein
MAPPDDFSVPDRPAVADGRLGRIIGAYLLACFAAALVRTIGLVVEESIGRGFATVLGENGAGALILVPVASTVVIFVAAAPFATACLMVAENRRWRSPFGYLLAGAAIGPATQILVAIFDGSTAVPSAGLSGLAAASGLTGGWVHWLVAIRSAPPAPRLRREPATDFDDAESSPP